MPVAAVDLRSGMFSREEVQTQAVTPPYRQAEPFGTRLLSAVSARRWEPRSCARLCPAFRQIALPDEVLDARSLRVLHDRCSISVKSEIRRIKS